VLAAAVEILLASDDVSMARRASDELSALAARLDTPLLHATSAQAMGAVLLAEGSTQSSLAALRTAWTIWREIDAPYEAARAQVLIGRACLALGDVDSAQLELDAASRVFQHLGAAPDLARLNDLLRAQTSSSDAPTTPPVADASLTAREVEVLRLVATGKTNRAIADELEIAEKTVARHISNIFTKLDLSTRAAATAYAYQHRLL
jgi:DNA-binding CsgD family transcriptional regulator